MKRTGEVVRYHTRARTGRSHGMASADVKSSLFWPINFVVYEILVKVIVPETSRYLHQPSLNTNGQITLRMAALMPQTERFHPRRFIQIFPPLINRHHARIGQSLAKHRGKMMSGMRRMVDVQIGGHCYLLPVGNK